MNFEIVHILKAEKNEYPLKSEGYLFSQNNNK